MGLFTKDIKLADRYVTVKGLVERTVKSDSATWPISFSEAGESLPEVYAASEKDKAAVLAFLTAQGFGGAEVTLGSVAEVVMRKATCPVLTVKAAMRGLIGPDSFASRTPAASSLGNPDVAELVSKGVQL